MHKLIAILGSAPDASAANGACAIDVARSAGIRRMRRHRVEAGVPRDHVRSALQQVAAVDECWTNEATPTAATQALRSVYGTALLQLSAVQELTIFAQPDDSAQAVVHRISLLQRSPALTPAAFRDYWQHTHAPLARCHRHVARYVQNHVLDGATQDGAPLFDGIAQFEITDLQGMQADYATPEGQRMRADVAHFAGTVTSFIVQPHDVTVQTH